MQQCSLIGTTRDTCAVTGSRVFLSDDVCCLACGFTVSLYVCGTTFAGYAVVKKGRDKRSGDPVAIKVFLSLGKIAHSWAAWPLEAGEPETPVLQESGRNGALGAVNPNCSAIFMCPSSTFATAFAFLPCLLCG